MVACSRCHFMNPVKQKACQACGNPLPFSSAPSHERPGEARPTLRGMRSPDPLPAHAHGAFEGSNERKGASSQPTSDQTMPSLQSPTPEQIRVHKSSSTLLGHVSPAVMSHEPPGDNVHPLHTLNPAASLPLRHAPDPRATPPVSSSSRQATWVGLAPVSPERPLGVSASSTSQTMPSMPAVGAERQVQASPNAVGDDGAPITPAASRAAAKAIHGAKQGVAQSNPARTYLAVTVATNPDPVHSEPAKVERDHNVEQAQTHLGLSSPPPLPARPSDPPPLTVPRMVDSNLVPVPATTVPRISRRVVQSRLGTVVLTVSALLGAGLLAFTWLWNPAPPLTGSIDPASSSLELVCESCGEGSTVAFDGSTSSFKDGRAALDLVRPPRVGTNTFRLDVRRAGLGRDEQVELSVEVDYRAQWELSGLEAHPAHLAVGVEAVPGVSIKVDDQEVPLSQGRGTHVVPLSLTIKGSSSSIQWLERTVELSALGGKSSTASSPLRIRLPVVPLTVETPWPTFRTNAATVVLSGYSAPRASITSGETVTRTDDTGYFEFPVKAHLGLNTVELEASAPEHAPRFVTASFTRVDNLTPVALAYQQNAIRRFDELTAALTQHNPVSVALAGKAQEWRTTRNRTAILVSVTSGCPSRVCLVRVEYPGPIELSPNQAISVFGVATAEPQGQSLLPQIQSQFILL